MNPRERVIAALSFQPVDRIPLQIHPSPGGLFDHGQKLIDLMRACGHDFDDQKGLTMPVVPKEDIDAAGRFHRIAKDEWGTTWEYRTYGIWGYRINYPLADINCLANYHPPTIQKLQGKELTAAQSSAAAQRKTFFQLVGGVSLFETMQSLRPFMDVMIDIAQDTREINRLADLLIDYYSVIIENALAVGVDGVMVGDDFGTQTAMMLSPKMWRHFFLPRYRTLFEPVKRAGKYIFFHSCGKVEPILPDLKSAGADVIWPQLPLFDSYQLSRLSKELKLSIMLHPDRGELMQWGTPEQVRDYIYKLIEDFDCFSGGSCLYLEIDPGFPWQNIRSLFETVMEIRKTTRCY
jgi:hypothetical protein